MTAKTEKPGLAARRGRDVVRAFFVVLAAGFIGLSTLQLARQVFGFSNTYPEVTSTCAFALRFFEQGLDRVEARALHEATGGGPQETFTDSVRMELDTVEKQCTGPEDEAAVVAAKRLREATRSQLEIDQANLARLRRAVDMRIGR